MGRKIAWGIYGIIMIAVLCLVSFQIYRVVTGQVASYGFDPNKNITASSESAAPEDGASGQPERELAQTEQVQKLSQYVPRAVVDLGGTESSVTFRTQSSNEVCTITTDLASVDSEWIVPYTDANGAKASGPGVMCSIVRAVPLHGEDEVGCDQGVRKGETFTVNTAGVGVGACMSGNSPLKNDALGRADQRMALPELRMHERVQIGDFACGADGAEMTCVNMYTGQGFTFGPVEYELLR